ncbi:MAG TPA: ribonuclease H-like domain-containing protein [Methanobacterium sp.]|jgi:hypothetical protein|nr:MAG: exonuclease [Methanobacterium sp.]HOI71385.1 ribonuclease H-like domain-containing protein [Methanobacterium sp.]
MYHEVDDASKLQRELLERYEGRNLEEVFKGETCKTPQGSCYKIEDREKFKIKRIEVDKAKSAILCDLKILQGIGEAKEHKLKTKGFNTIEDLRNHPTYSHKADEFICKLDESPMDCIREYFPGSNPKQVYSSSFRELNDFLFFDIETLGLRNEPVILIGMARILDSHMKVTQYLATGLDDEKPIIQNFLSDLNEETVFVSFNGRGFDLPFIRSRAYHHGISRRLRNHHMDMLYLSRRTWGGALPNCRLQTLEKHFFDLYRQDDVPSSQVPAFYRTYMNTGNVGPLVPIVEHNKIDIITLARILSKLNEDLITAHI